MIFFSLRVPRTESLGHVFQPHAQSFPHELARYNDMSSFALLVKLSLSQEKSSIRLHCGQERFCSSSTYRGRLTDELCTMCDSLVLP